MNPEAKLAEIGFFGSLSPENLKQLAYICIPKKVKKKEVIFLEGSKGGLFYQLISGTVQLYRLSEDGKEVAIKTVRPGEIFAEVILFEQDRYPVCASAITDCELLAVPSIQFSCLLENPEFRNDFVSMLMRKQRYLTDRIMFLTSHDAESRFFSFLIEQYGDSGVYRIKMSKKDISKAIGVSPETFSRLVHKLGEAGVLDWSADALRIDLDYLSKIDISGR
jgi:CRP/FNR family transcriptional regulator